MSDWHESTEGDLDPDLTEEAGYAGWDPPGRNRWPPAFRILAVLAIVAMLGTVILALIR
jgi:hypothetical protein